MSIISDFKEALQQATTMQNDAERRRTTRNDTWTSGMRYLCIVINEQIV